MLGRSESLLEFTALFAFPNKEHRFYSKKAAGAHASMEMVGRGFAREEPGRPVSSPPENCGRLS